jgi:hypothetical protein
MKSKLFILILTVVAAFQAEAKKEQENNSKTYVSIPGPMGDTEDYRYVMLYKAKRTENKTQTTVNCLFVPVLPTQENQLTREQAFLSPGALSITTEVVKNKMFGKESNTSHVQGEFLASRLNTAAYFLSQDLKTNRAAYDPASVYFMDHKMLAVDVSKLLQESTDARVLKFGEIVSKELVELCETNK